MRRWAVAAVLLAFLASCGHDETIMECTPQAGGVMRCVTK